ncbi:MarR family transcriptional regulator [Allorhizobium sp. BGMRC 0089]|uniref:MarR family winged helix-turn-helix transcriptional regulator n=1 Tax=Allorhizobium sonneratiae TaxID=2934936 RepID=UPI0020348602|nr:MarR family transcriptional regulator [Allorhizobium sonneratiae]MCM2291646.1 MarR family transcriptional regulator [Allorhizobium sonneratiae]
MDFDRKASPAYLIAQLAKEFSRCLLDRSADLGFSPGQFPVLVELWQENGLTQKQLLERIDVEQATMANTLKRMQRDGLIERQPHPGDRRAQCIFLTEKAIGLKQQAFAAIEDVDSRIFAGFRRFEKELMLEFIRQALENARG